MSYNTMPTNQAAQQLDTKTFVLSAAGLCLGTALAVFSFTTASAGTSLYVASGIKPVSQLTTRTVEGFQRRPVNANARAQATVAYAQPPRQYETEQAPTPAAGFSLPAIGSMMGVFVAGLSLVGLVSVAQPQPALAFENAAPEAAQYAKKGKSPGKQPTNLGVLERKELDGALGLASCGGAPNCFSTSGPDVKIPHTVAPWTAPAGTSPEEAIAQVKAVVEAYPPYQNQIDGGGFKIVTAEPTYLYIQFESLVSGFIDDVEFAANPNGEGVLLRSSSRQGYLDQAVNAKRLNWISEQLRKAGWTAPELTREGYLSYFKQNNLEFF